jgi:preprotein translocase subunit SecF
MTAGKSRRFEFMKKLFAVLFLLALLVIALGFYRGWFVLSSRDADEGNKVNVNLAVDKDKMEEDAKAVKKKTTELTDKVTDGEKNTDDRPTDNVKASDR